MLKLSNFRSELDKFHSDINDENYKNRELYTASSSDSIVLFSKDDTTFSLDLITTASSLSMSMAINYGIPLKGCLAHGEISVNKDKQIYFGQPLMDAYLLQEDLFYYGITAHGSIDSFFSTTKYFLEDPNYYLRTEVKTPFKSGAVVHRNINWFKIHFAPNISAESKKEKFDEIIESLRTTTSGAPRRYIDNTIEVFEALNKQE